MFQKIKYKNLEYWWWKKITTLFGFKQTFQFVWNFILSNPLQFLSSRSWTCNWTCRNKKNLIWFKDLKFFGQNPLQKIEKEEVQKIGWRGLQQVGSQPSDGAQSLRPLSHVHDVPI